MARIAGVDIPNEKRVEISLRYIFGIGPTSASTICEKTGIDPATKARDLTDDGAHPHPRGARPRLRRRG